MNETARSLVPEDVNILRMCEIQRLTAEKGKGRGKQGCRAGQFEVADWLASSATHCSPHLNQFHLS